MIPEFFTPQDEWLDQVGRIYVLLQSVQLSDDATAHRVELRRKNRINSVHSSTAIEGNRLTLDEVTAVVNGHTIYGPEKDVLEVQNAWAAYEALDSFDPYSVDDFLKAHGLLTKGLISESGSFRSKDVEIVNEDEEVLHTGSRVAKVPRLIAELLEWASATSAHPLVASSATHFLIEHIHPFQDGNGRVGRLWQTLMLSRWNPLFAWMPTETLIARNQDGYYTALQASREPEIDAAPFITYMLGVIEASLQEYQASVVVNVADDVVVNDAVLALLRDDPSLSAARVAERLGLSSRQVQRIIKAWRDHGVLTREGSAKAGRWIVNEKRAERGGVQ
ncbi:MAG: Fic family protein [Propionibacteriaceae bacterium]|jgi:Fic family protein|nr:Fic family protein [Propionibacteriaceae bacterium]